LYKHPQDKVFLNPLQRWKKGLETKKLWQRSCNGIAQFTAQILSCQLHVSLRCIYAQFASAPTSEG